MTRLERSTYALSVALLPATAVIVGIIIPAQIPCPIEVAAVALVIPVAGVPTTSSERNSSKPPCLR